MLVDGNNLVQKRPVGLGIRGANSQEISFGLQVGDRVIIGGLSAVQPGEKVAPQAAPNSLANYQKENGKGGQ